MYTYTTAQLILQHQNNQKQLWISGQLFAHNLYALQKHNITAVCSVGSDSFLFPSSINHLYLEVEDTEDQDIARVLDQSFEFIEEHRKNSNVLVHCIAGVSRSATVVAYYLMKKYKWGVEESLRKIRSKREIIRPNLGFYRQLKALELGMKSGCTRARL